MPIEQALGTTAFPVVVDDAATGHALTTRPPATPSNLAQLLDSFTQAVNKPEAETIGSFAATVEALHSELAMLARVFGAPAPTDGGSEQFEFTDIFPDTTEIEQEPLEPGIAQAEELEHFCRELSRG